MRRIDIGNTQFEERTVSIKRVAKVVKGGKRFSFSAVVVVGDKNGNVGTGLGKANEIGDAIRKGIEDAKKNVIPIPMKGTTITHEIEFKYGASKIILRPASRGTGVIAGSTVRAIMDLAGITDVLTKCIGSSNPHNLVKVTMMALSMLKKEETKEVKI
ncbi:MAG: 30S ribosomal protein S5 [Candidatus Firestonebacteria bacterium]